MKRIAALFVAIAAAQLSASAQPDRFAPLKSALTEAKVQGYEFAAARDGKVIVHTASDLVVCEPIGSCPSAPYSEWRWASVTKQIIAVLVLQEAAKGRIDLDAPLSRYLPKFKSPNANAISVRQLLRHQTGLPNPDDTAAGSGGMSAYYLPGYKGSRDPLRGYCAGPVKGPAGGNWAYNNCDYIVAGSLLKAVTGKSWERLVKDRIARPLGLKSLRVQRDGYTPEITRFQLAGMAEPGLAFSAFGSAGALAGSAEDLLAFDFALLSGKLLPPAQLAQLWDGQADLGYIALGQWAFSVPLKGCTEPVRIIERRGSIGAVQVRNFILPDQKVAAVAFVGGQDFDFGEIWQGSGFSHDLLALAACSTEAK